MYAEGKGVEKNEEMANELITLAADQDFEEAKKYLGITEEEISTENTEESTTSAQQIYVKKCKEGISKENPFYGIMEEKKDGDKKDKT